MKIKSVVYLLFAAAIAVSCSGEEIRLTYSNQATGIDNYVKKQLESNPEMRAEITEGIVRLVVSEGEGPELEKDGSLYFKYAGYDFSGFSIDNSKLFATNDIETADQARWNVSDSTLFRMIKIDLAENSLLEGLQKGLVGARSSEECYVLFTGEKAFGGQTLGTIPAYAPLAYHFWITEIENK